MSKVTSILCIVSSMCNVPLIFFNLKDHLFKWVEEAVLDEVEDVLPKVAVHEIEIAKMKADIEDLMEVALNNKVEIQKNKVMIKTLMVYSLFVSAAFVVYVLY